MLEEVSSERKGELARWWAQECVDHLLVKVLEIEDCVLGHEAYLFRILILGCNFELDFLDEYLK